MLQQAIQHGWGLPKTYNPGVLSSAGRHLQSQIVSTVLLVRISTPSNCLLLLFLFLSFFFSGRVLKNLPSFYSSWIYCILLTSCLPQEAPEWLLSSWKECLNLEGKLEFWGTSHTTLQSERNCIPLQVSGPSAFPQFFFPEPSSQGWTGLIETLICGCSPFSGLHCSSDLNSFLHNGTVCHPLSHIEEDNVTSLKLKSQSHPNRQLCLWCVSAAGLYAPCSISHVASLQEAVSASLSLPESHTGEAVSCLLPILDYLSFSPHFLESLHFLCRFLEFLFFLWNRV